MRCLFGPVWHWKAKKTLCDTSPRGPDANCVSVTPVVDLSFINIRLDIFPKWRTVFVSFLNQLMKPAVLHISCLKATFTVSRSFKGAGAVSYRPVWHLWPIWPCVLSLASLWCLFTVKGGQVHMPTYVLLNEMTADCLSSCQGHYFKSGGSPPTPPPHLTPVVMCCNSLTCPLARCLLYYATRALYTYPVKPELCLQPYASPSPPGYF